MDPLSVAASIVGILAAAGQVSANISTLVENSRKASKNIRKVKDEVDTIRSTLHQLQALLLGSAKTSRARTSLILVDQVVVTLTACVSTFSELDVIVGSLVSDERLGLMDRLRWATKAAAIDESLKNLQVQKSTLTLMLTILTCKASYNTEDSVTNLAGLVESMLADHTTLAKRLSSIEMAMATTTKTENPTQNNHIDLSAIGTFSMNQFGFVFEEELNGSRVYRRAARRMDGASSIVSSAGKTTSWSMLTGLSLSNISNLAVLALPIYAEEVSNRELYQFGKVDNSDWRQDAAFLPTLGPGRIGKGFKGVTVFGLTKPPKNSSAETANSSEAEPNLIFGVPLLSSMEVASVTTGSVGEDEEMFISGHIPTVVARCCAYIKEDGTKTREIFFRPGSATRIQELEKIFNSGDQSYGSDILWEKYQVEDAASLLLRYLKLLPEPIIPPDCFMAFAAVYRELTSATDADEGRSWAQLDAHMKSLILTTLHLAFMKTPSINRHLLLYLLDLLQTCAGHSNLNLMTADRLVAVFQPSILSLGPEEMSIEEHQVAHQVIVFMIENWEEGGLREIMNTKRTKIRRFQEPANSPYSLRNGAFERPTARRPTKESSRDFKPEEKTAAGLKDNGKSKNDDPNLLTSMPIRYPDLEHSFANPRKAPTIVQDSSGPGWI